MNAEVRATEMATVDRSARVTGEWAVPHLWDWDVTRLAASTELAGRDNGFSKSVRSDIVLTTVCAYRDAMWSLDDAAAALPLRRRAGCT